VTRHSAGIERRQVDRLCGAVSDQLRHRLAGRGRIEDAPDAVAGGDIGAGNAGHRPDQRQPVPSDRAIARLPREGI
jgi:hypothetical protein